jgi:hypothetical protein
MRQLLNKLLCALLGHDEWTDSDADGPYQHVCVRCGWTHPLHGQSGNDRDAPE